MIPYGNDTPYVSWNTSINGYTVPLPLRFDGAPAGSRTSDLSITSPTPNRCITKATDMDLAEFAAGSVSIDGTEGKATKTA